MVWHMITHQITWAGLPPIYCISGFVMCTILIWYRALWVQKACRLLAGVWASFMITGVSRTTTYSKALLHTLAALGMMIALMRPQGDAVELLVHAQGRDVVFALDISRSMLAADLAPNRLTIAKEKIINALSLLKGERVGLILFSSTAFVQCPLTDDLKLFKMLLDAVDSETVSRGSTALDVVLLAAIDLFKRMPERKSKLVVMLTDGEDFSTNLESVRREVHELGMHLYIIGVGSPQGAPIPILDMHGKQSGFEKDEQGAVIMSRLQENLLSNLAHSVDGWYGTATRDASDINHIIDRVKQFEKEELADKKVENRAELYWYPLVVSVICLLLEWLL